MTREEIENLEKDHNFRVSIFGSARMMPDHPVYKMAYELARRLADENIGVVTGGGPGIMEAANQGHKAGNSTGQSKSIGLTIELPWENEANHFLDAHIRFQKFSGRLDQFMILSDAVVIMPGGIGTCLELFYTWQLVQVKHICNIPIITVGTTWKELIDWVNRGLLDTEHTISEEDMDMIFTVSTPEDALEILCDSRDAHEKAGAEYCLNWKKYK